MASNPWARTREQIIDELELTYRRQQGQNSFPHLDPATERTFSAVGTGMAGLLLREAIMEAFQAGATWANSIKSPMAQVYPVIQMHIEPHPKPDCRP